MSEAETTPNLLEEMLETISIQSKNQDTQIVIPDDFPPEYQGHSELEQLSPYGEVVLWKTRQADKEELIDRLRGADAAINIRAYSKFDADLFAALPHLRAVSILGTGTDNVDLDAATRHGVVVSNTPGASATSVAELTVGLMIAAARNVAQGDAWVRSGQWRHGSAFELRGRTLGLIGLGAIAQGVIPIAQAIGMKVIAWSRTHDEERAGRCGVTLVDLPKLLAASDVVSLHLRASAETAGIIGKKELATMKQTAILVNTARGALIDETALVEALSNRRIASAALDVFVQEPLPSSSPLLRLDNVVLSPHSGGVTEEASARLRQMAVDNLIAFFQGAPTRVVNPGVLGDSHHA